jgi:hypothetical protein
MYCVLEHLKCEIFITTFSMLAAGFGFFAINNRVCRSIFGTLMLMDIKELLYLCISHLLAINKLVAQTQLLRGAAFM